MSNVPLQGNDVLAYHKKMVPAQMTAIQCRLSGKWGVSGPIDAAVVWHGMTYLFRGQQYWRLNAKGNAPDATGTPMPIEREWGIRGPIDSALMWDDRLYFFATAIIGFSMMMAPARKKGHAPLLRTGACPE